MRLYIKICLLRAWANAFFSSQKYIRTLLFYLTLVFLRYHTVSQRGYLFYGFSVGFRLLFFYCDVGFWKRILEGYVLIFVTFVFSVSIVNFLPDRISFKTLLEKLLTLN